MAAFTAVSSWSKGLQDLDAANEIILAFQERRQALGQAIYTWGAGQSELAAGDSIQAHELWEYIQQWCEDNCDEFRDHTIDMQGATAAEAWDNTNYCLKKFTQATWRVEAGINSSGFKRATINPTTFSYGLIQPGDIVGPWIFEELQAGLSAMKETSILVSVANGTPQVKSDTSDFKASYADAYADISWPGSWSTGSSDDSWKVYAVRIDSSEVGTSPVEYRVVTTRFRRSVSITGIPSAISHVGEAYLFLVKTYADGSNTRVFYDHDSVTDGSTETFALMQDFSASATASRTFEPTYDGIPALGSPQDDYSQGLNASRASNPTSLDCSVYFVAKWQFTNA